MSSKSACAASFCKNTRYMAKKKGLNLMFHRFPVEENILRKWVQFCKRDDSWIPNQHYTLCSVHFRVNDYQMENSPLQNNRNILKVLKPSAFPSLIQSSPPNAQAASLQIGKKNGNKAKKSNVNSKKRKASSSVPSRSTPSANVFQQADESGEFFYASCTENTDNDTSCSSCIKKDFEIKELKLANDRKNKSYKQILEVNNLLSSKLRKAAKEIENCKKDMTELKKKINGLQSSLVTPTQDTQIIKNLLKSSLSSNQINILTGKRRKVKWTKDELGKAFTLRCFSKRAYKYMATDLNYPLPSISALQRYAQKLDLKQGILNSSSK